MFLFAISRPNKDLEIAGVPSQVAIRTPSSEAKCPIPLFSKNDEDSSVAQDLGIIEVVPTAVTTMPGSSSMTSAIAPSQISMISLFTALSIAFTIVTFSELLYSVWGISNILSVSAIAIAGATLLPKAFYAASASGNIIGTIFMQFFFAVTGAQGHIPTVLKVAPSLLVHSLLQVTVHFVVAVQLGKLLKLPFNEVVLASNANVGGPTTAASMATAKRWKALVVPSLLTGVFGYAIATVIGVFFYKVAIPGIKLIL